MREFVPRKRFVVENVIIDREMGEFTLVSVEGQLLRVELEGDCCSQSNFDDDSLEDLRGLFAHEIRKIEDVEAGPVRRWTYNGDNDKIEPDPVDVSECLAPHPDLVETPKHEGEVVSPHFLVIHTDRGGYSIAWRNDSNGYYDGNPVFYLDGELLDYRWAEGDD